MEFYQLFRFLSRLVKDRHLNVDYIRPFELRDPMFIGKMYIKRPNAAFYLLETTEGNNLKLVIYVGS